MTSYLERQAAARAAVAAGRLHRAMVGEDVIAKANEPRSLYVCRKLKNGEGLRRWALAAGLPNVEPVEELHVTIAYSRRPVAWLDMGQTWDEELTVPAGGPRTVERLGPESATVGLAFVSDQLRYRNEEIRERGASWDWPGYLAHITIAKRVPPEFDVGALVPFRDRLTFGPEIFEEIDDEVGKAADWQPRRTGGQWNAVGGLVAPHMPADPLARHRWSGTVRASGQTQAERTGRAAYRGNDAGVVLMNPQEPTDPRFNGDPEAVATFVADIGPGFDIVGAPFEPWDGSGIADLIAIADEPRYPVAGTRRLGAAVVIQEPDGRVWTVTPTNGFGGIYETLPKAGRDAGASLAAKVVREAWDETGLQVRLTGWLGDLETMGAVMRVYRGVRVGGSPSDFGWETAAVNLVPVERLAERLNGPFDRAIVALLRQEPPEIVKAAQAMDGLRLGFEVEESEEVQKRTEPGTGVALSDDPARWLVRQALAGGAAEIDRLRDPLAAPVVAKRLGPITASQILRALQADQAAVGRHPEIAKIWHELRASVATTLTFPAGKVSKAGGEDFAAAIVAAQGAVERHAWPFYERLLADLTARAEAGDVDGIGAAWYPGPGRPSASHDAYRQAYRAANERAQEVAAAAHVAGGGETVERISAADVEVAMKLGLPIGKAVRPQAPAVVGLDVRPASPPLITGLPAGGRLEALSEAALRIAAAREPDVAARLQALVAVIGDEEGDDADRTRVWLADWVESFGGQAAIDAMTRPEREAVQAGVIERMRLSLTPRKK